MLFTFLLFINVALPPQSDDIEHIFSKGGFEGAKIRYLSWNGRFGELLFAGFVAKINPYLFDAINASVGAIFVLVFFAIIFWKIPRGVKDASIIALVLFLLMKFCAFGANFAFGSGSLNYMWGICLVMVFLLPYRFYALNFIGGGESPKQPRKKLLKIIAKTIFLPFSFCAGMANEMLGIVVIIALFALNIYVLWVRFAPHRLFLRFIKFKRFARFTQFTRAKAKAPKILLFLNLAFMCFIVGYLTLYFSPGHHLRASYTSAYMSLSDIWELNMGDKVEHIFYTLINFTSPILLVLGAFLGVALVAMLKQMQDSKGDFKSESHCNSKGKFYLVLVLLFVAYCLCALSTIQFSPLPHRARLGDSLIVIAMIALVWDRFANFRALQKGVIALCALYAVFVGSAFVEYRIKWNAMVSAVEQSKARGENEVEVDYIFYSFYENLIDWSQPTKNANAFPNPHYAKYFGVDSFAVK